MNRLESVTDTNLQATTYGYDNVGNRQSVSYPNGNTTDYVYDSLNRLTRQTTTDTLANVLLDSQYTLGNSGHRTKILEASGRVSDYIYDDLYRLTDEIVTDVVNGDYSASYSYDAVGNRTGSTINSVSTVYSYDDNDHLISAGGETYTYDDNGNTISKSIDGQTSSYRYDARNMMSGATLLEGGVTTESSYSYDIDGIHIGKTENGNAIDYLVDHNRDYAQVLRETDQGSGLSLDYLYGDDLIMQSQNSANERYYLYDGLGSTRALSDTAGLTTDSYDYEGFGTILNKTGTSENSYLFTGEQFDLTLGQQYLRARYYDPNIARFTQMDEWRGDSFEPLTLHKYLYAGADPANKIDPSGRSWTLQGLSQTLAVASTIAAIGSASYSSFIGSRGVQGNSYTETDYGWALISSMVSTSSKYYTMLNSKHDASGDAGSNYEHGVLEKDCKSGDNCYVASIITPKQQPWSVNEGWVKCNYICPKTAGSNTLPRWMPEEIGCPTPTSWAPGWVINPPSRKSGDLLSQNPFGMNLR